MLHEARTLTSEGGSGEGETRRDARDGGGQRQDKCVDLCEMRAAGDVTAIQLPSTLLLLLNGVQLREEAVLLRVLDTGHDARLYTASWSIHYLFLHEFSYLYFVPPNQYPTGWISPSNEMLDSLDERAKLEIHIHEV